MEQERYCGIVILNYNTPEDTLACVKSIINVNSAAIKIVVVDNASTDQSVPLIIRGIKALEKEYIVINAGDSCRTLPPLTMVISKKNGGYAQGNNCGISLLKQDASVDSVMILNSDVLFVEDIIPQLKATLSNEGVAIVSPVLYKKGLMSFDYNCARKIPSFFEIFIHFLMSAHEPKCFKDRRYLLKQLPRDKKIQVGLPSGSCMLFSKDLCNTVGIFDPQTFLYYEENIIASKITSMNLGKIIVDTDLKCIHLGATSTKKSPSRKIVKCEVDSARYFVNNYTKVSFAKKMIFKWVTEFYLVLDSIKRAVKEA